MPGIRLLPLLLELIQEIKNIHETPIANVEMKFPQALRKEINLQRKSDWGFPFHCVSQTKLLNFTMSCVSASTQVQKLRKGTFFSSFPAHVEGSFCFLHMVSHSPCSRQTPMPVNPGQAYAALLLPHLKTFSTELTTRL